MFWNITVAADANSAGGGGRRRRETRSENYPVDASAPFLSSSLPTLLPHFPPFLPSLPPFSFAVFYNSSLFFLLLFFFSNSDLDIPPRSTGVFSGIDTPILFFPSLFLLSWVICLKGEEKITSSNNNRCEPPFSPRCFWTLDELTDGDPLLRPFPSPLFCILKGGGVVCELELGFQNRESC